MKPGIWVRLHDLRASCAVDMNDRRASLFHPFGTVKRYGHKLAGFFRPLDAEITIRHILIQGRRCEGHELCTVELLVEPMIHRCIPGVVQYRTIPQCPRANFIFSVYPSLCYANIQSGLKSIWNMTLLIGNLLKNNAAMEWIFKYRLLKWVDFACFLPSAHRKAVGLSIYQRRFTKLFYIRDAIHRGWMSRQSYRFPELLCHAVNLCLMTYEFGWSCNSRYNLQALSANGFRSK